MFFSKDKQKTSRYSILLMEYQPVPSDPSINKLFFFHSPLLSVLCSCILICLILPKNRLITDKQLHRILIAFKTVILAHHSERILKKKQVTLPSCLFPSLLIMHIDHVKGQFSKLMDTICHETSQYANTHKETEYRTSRKKKKKKKSKSVSSLGFWVTFNVKYVQVCLSSQIRFSCNIYC